MRARSKASGVRACSSSARLKVGVVAGFVGHQTATAQSPGQRPGLALGVGGREVAVGEALGLVATAQPDVGLHQLGPRPQVDIGDAQPLQQLMLALEFRGRPGGLAETKLELTQ